MSGTDTPSLLVQFLMGNWVCLYLRGALLVDQRRLSYTQLFVPAGPAHTLYLFKTESILVCLLIGLVNTI